MPSDLVQDQAVCTCAVISSTDLADSTRRRHNNDSIHTIHSTFCNLTNQAVRDSELEFEPNTEY